MIFYQIFSQFEISWLHFLYFIGYIDIELPFNDRFRFQNTRPNLTKAIEFAGDRLFDTGIDKRQYMKEVLILIIAGYQNITQRVEQVVGYMKMRG